MARGYADIAGGPDDRSSNGGGNEGCANDNGGGNKSTGLIARDNGFNYVENHFDNRNNDDYNNRNNDHYPGTIDLHHSHQLRHHPGQWEYG